MKTLHLSIIVSTVAIATILAFLILHNESDSIFTSKELTVEGLKDTYGVGEQINFKIEFDELLGSCTQPHVTVENQTNQIIWESKEIAVPCSTDTTLRHGKGELEFGNPDLGYLRINQTGSYYIHIWFAKEIVEKITVIQSNNNDENHTNTSEKNIDVGENKIIVLNETTYGPGSISSTTDILFGIGFDKIMHVNQYATGNYNFVLKPGSLGIIGMKYHSLNACNGIWQNNICLTSQQQNISSNYVIRSYPTKADVYTMPPDGSFVGNGSAVGITITEQWKSIDNFTSFVNYTINTTPQANGTYDIMIRDSGPGQFLTIGTIPYNGTFPSVSIY